MPPERHGPGDPMQWLRRAKSNLVRARLGSHIPDVCLEDLCFDAQQAVEKSVKAVLIRMRVDFPYTHNLARLLSLAEQAGVPVPDAVKSAEALTRYATAMRYPGMDEPVSEDECLEAFSSAEIVVTWVEKLLSEPQLEL